MTAAPVGSPQPDPPRSDLRERLYIVIFGTETPAGRAFDIALLAVIVLSVIVVMLDSVETFRAQWRPQFVALEWLFTGLFTIEYVLRIYCARRRLRYALSFFGIVDLVALLPAYLSVVFAGAQSLLAVRILRLLRIFRVLKVVRMLGEARNLLVALRTSAPKIGVFIGGVLTVTVVIGSAMYLIEGADSGFTSIPRGVYWAIVTITTVGYGDIAPVTIPGQTLAAMLMIMGYGIIAVPTGIVSAEIVRAHEEEHGACPACGTKHHAEDAHFCRVCGTELLV